MSQLAVKLGYSMFLCWLSKNENPSISYRSQGSIPRFDVIKSKTSQVVDFIDEYLSGRGTYQLDIRAYKCSKRHLKVGIVGGKIGVFPTAQILNFDRAVLPDLPSILHTKFHIQKAFLSVPHEGVRAVLQHVFGGAMSSTTALIKKAKEDLQKLCREFFDASTEFERAVIEARINRQKQLLKELGAQREIF